MDPSDTALKEALLRHQKDERNAALQQSIGEIYEFSIMHFNLKTALKWYTLSLSNGNDYNTCLSAIERVCRKMKRRQIMGLE